MYFKFGDEIYLFKYFCISQNQFNVFLPKKKTTFKSKTLAVNSQ